MQFKIQGKEIHISEIKSENINQLKRFEKATKATLKFSDENTKAVVTGGTTELKQFIFLCNNS